MTYSKPRVTLEKYTLAESVMTEETISLPIIEENDETYETQSVSSSTLSAFGEVLDFSKK